MYFTRYPVLSCEQNKAIWLATVSAVWYDMCGTLWHSMVLSYGQVWYGMVWYGMVWYGMVWYGMVWYGMVWYGMVYGIECRKIDSATQYYARKIFHFAFYVKS